MRRRLPLVLLGAGALALIALGVFWTAGANRRDWEQTQNILSMQSQTIARHVNAWQPEYSAHLQRVVSSNPRHLRVLLYDLSGWEIGRPGGSGAVLPLNQTPARLVSPSMLRPRHEEQPLAPFAEWPSGIRDHPRIFNRLFASNILGAAWVDILPTATGERWLVATTAVNDYDAGAGRAFISAWLQAGMREADALRPLQERWWRLGFVAAAAGALLGGWTWWTTRQHRALNRIASAAERLPLDRLSTTRLEEPPDDDDVQRLTRACNRLLDRVAEVHAGQQRFVADAAHELRTPLTILRGEIQVALREPSNHPLLIETLRSNLDEAVHLSRLVDSLLTLARADAGQALALRQPIELVPLLRQTLDKLEPLAGKRRCRLELKPDPAAAEVAVQGDPIALERIVFNLVENALKHSPAGEAVTVTLEASASQARLTVTDRGIGMAPEHLARIFDRFYRVDAARRRSDGGVGLGLAIVRTLTEAHGGRVTVRSEIGHGSSFTVELPLIEPHAQSR